jgi:hypothetical protein
MILFLHAGNFRNYENRMSFILSLLFSYSQYNT